MKPGDMGIYDVPHERVMTVNGPGTLVHYEVSYRYRLVWRMGVKLDENPFSFSPAYYQEGDVIIRNLVED